MPDSYVELSPAARAALWQAAQGGDEDARAELVLLNRPLVYRLAQCFAGGGDPADFYQGGMLGLIEAVRRFDPARGCAFATYATPFIKGELVRVAELARGRKHGDKQAVLRRRLRAAEERLTAELQRAPGMDELAAALELPPEELVLLTESDFTLSAAVPVDEGAAVAYDAVEDKLLATALLAGLPPDDRRLLTARFYENRSQAELAAHFGVSQAQISRRLRAVLQRLRQTAAEENGYD